MSLKMSFNCVYLLLYCPIFIMNIARVKTLSLTPFTYRYNEYITSERFNTCGIRCQCPDSDINNLCICSEDGGDTFSIEGPLAAILLSINCLPPLNVEGHAMIGWPPNNESLTVDVLMADGDEALIEIFGTEEVLRQLKSWPRTDYKINMYYMYMKEDLKVSRTRFEGMKDKMSDVSTIYILIPGFASGFGHLFDAYKDAILDTCNDTRDCGLIVVDWMFGNQFYLEQFNERIYEDAAMNSVYVGHYIAMYLSDAKLTSKMLGPHVKYHIIAFDLGSEVAHFAASIYQQMVADHEDNHGVTMKIDRISAFNPPIFLFEDEHLRQEDASFVDVYHSNPMRKSIYTRNSFYVENVTERIENYVLRREVLTRNLKERRFGDPRRRGHLDIYINIDMDTYDMNHVQCIETPTSDAYFGCPASMASRVFLDSILKRNRQNFEVTSSNPDDSGIDIGHVSVLYGWNADEKDADKHGAYHVQYKMDMCSIRHKKSLGFVPTLTADEKDRLIGPKDEQLASTRLDTYQSMTFPLEEPDLMRKSEDEKYENCGEFKLDRMKRRDIETDARIWKGNRIVSKNMFPWTACIKSFPMDITKYLEIVVGDERYKRPEEMMYQYQYYWRERVSRLKDNGQDIAIDTNNPGQTCSGSLISDHFILTAAHCFDGYVNEADIIVTIGDQKCGQSASEGIRINVEMENPIGKTIFVPNDWINHVDDIYNQWIRDNLGLLTPSDEIDLFPSVNYDVFDTFTRHQMMVRMGFEVDDHCQAEPKLRPVHRAKDVMDSGADIGLIRIPIEDVSNDVRNNLKMCFRSSSSINVPQFNQHIYLASHGYKGFDVQDGSDPHGHASLTWLPLRTINYVQRKLIEDPNFNISYEKLSVRYVNNNYYYLVNTDFDEDGHIITSSACQGDSGGPLFVYGQRAHGTQFAVQVGVISGSNSEGAPGAYPISRANGLDACAKEFRYNVHMKKYTMYQQRVTRLDLWLPWINQLVDGFNFNQNKKLKTGP